MKQLRKRAGLPAWKQWLIVLCVFVLGISVGQLLLTVRWQLIASVLVAGLVLVVLVFGDARKR